MKPWLICTQRSLSIWFEVRSPSNYHVEGPLKEGKKPGGSLQPVRREPPATRSGLLKVGAHTARLGCSGGRVARLFMHSVHRHWFGRRQSSAAT